MAQYRPKQRAMATRASPAPVRLLDRRGGSEPLAIATQKQSPKPRRSNGSKTLYRPKSDGPRRKTPPPLPPAPAEDAQVLVQRLNTCDQRLKSCREQQDGVESASARAPLRRTCVELINAYPQTAKRLSISERLWRSWYREIEEEQSSSVLAACSTFYSSLVNQLQASLRRPNRSPEHLDGLKHSLQLALVALGDVARYEQNRREKGETRDWNAARTCYQHALEVAPSSGKVYNQLGLLAVLEGKLVDGAYLYARSLAGENPFANSSNLLHVLQRGRTADKQLQMQRQTSGSPSCEAMETYAARVLSCLHMLLTGKDCKSEWGEAVKRVQTALAHLLDVCDQQDESMPIDGSLLETLSSMLTHAICLTIALTHGAQHAIGETSSRRTFDEAFTSGAGNERAQKALEVGNVMISCVLLKLTTLLSTSAESTRCKYFANALLPALNVYLDWLHLHETLLHKLNPGAAALQEHCVALFHTMSASGFIERGLCCARKRDNDLSSAVLPEDREMNGFLPYEGALLARFPEELTPEKNSSRQLTEEERLVLRATRFMASSERFVFSGKPPTPISSIEVATSSKPRAARITESSTTKTTRRASNGRNTTTNVDPFAIDPVLSGRLCILCSNTSTFADGVCEFCGYEDEDFDVDTVSDDGGDSLNQTSWIQQYDLAYSNNVSSPGRSPASPRSPPVRRGSSASSSSSPQSASPMSPPGKLEIDFKTIMSIGSDKDDFQDGLAASKVQRRLVVIDAPNVAMRHGKGKVFSCAGIDLAVNYFQALGHRVIAFIPDYMLQSDDERAEREEQGEVLTAAKIPDNVALLERLVLQGVLIPTPPQDYDDSYSIQYAGLHDGYVVTNDLFRDHIVNMVGPRERKVAMRAWLRAHQISYSWVRNEFLPNPNFRFPDAGGSAL
ncbi:hypothetical protein PF005_g7637 [Phytophthora fragariae]|uniref:RNase NYN domain-containing protein n=1 Tax=Phytophthora fragariae TaxID=53985 RepID=A0A6A4EDM7_9STRA|nr:hypothetical protein PF003_g18079 [Phytophthora fragariae]KAE8941792.1 hypothetical protein PF009_g8422 [Phytophthora fragariae]KAE9017828.1 hypothetical protein PF011_g6525 [Phytophthora fragariae]KAE9120998.1 hypothetical protein PF007_g7964 [Phytophthora fragariae]KAE9148576.1 hypothetical protein PF006_g6837 [Phytophthora fragariae]